MHLVCGIWGVNKARHGEIEHAWKIQTNMRRTICILPDIPLLCSRSLMLLSGHAPRHSRILKETRMGRDTEHNVKTRHKVVKMTEILVVSEMIQNLFLVRVAGHCGGAFETCSSIIPFPT